MAIRHDNAMRARRGPTADRPGWPAVTVLPIDDPTDGHYADIRMALDRAGTPIGNHDLFVAAHARSLDMTLVTHNMREFERVPGLRVDDWLAAPA